MGKTFEKFASIACTFAVEVLAIPRKRVYPERFRQVSALDWLGVGEGYKLYPVRNHAEISARKSFKTYRFP